MAPTPDMLRAAYDAGLKGVVSNDEDYRNQARLACYADPFHVAFPRAKGIGDGKLCLPYKACLILEPEFGRYESQTTGDCVSHSTRNAGMVDYCIDAYFGETKYRGRFCTENIYGARGHGGQGANCSTLANYVSLDGKGGFLVRKRYSDGSRSVDLSVYNGRTGHKWGRPGTPDWLNAIASENKALRVMRCRSLQEARDALGAGFGLSRCGWWGYSSTRNSDGVSGVRGRWAHAMAIVGSDDTDRTRQKYDEGLFLVQNSWGLWNGGPKVHDQPDGSFWIEGATFKREIDNGGVYIIASVRGYDRELVYDRIKVVSELSTAA
jgi:hypothetical protein